MTFVDEVSTEEELLQKLKRPVGLCTSIARTERQNAQIIKFILDACFLYCLQRSCRSSEAWTDVTGVVGDFDTYRYRIRQ